MEKNQKLHLFYALKRFANLLILLLVLTISMTSCSKDEINETMVEDSYDLTSSLNAAITSTSMEEILFTAVALIEHCHGENIRFTGIIENRVTTTTDAKDIVHYTRSFSTRGMTGTGLISGAEYDVLGGAEMFAIKDAVLNPNGTLNLSGSLSESEIVIHQGTLVFQNRADGNKVVARHIIRKIPGSSTTINEWKCGGK